MLRCREHRGTEDEEGKKGDGGRGREELRGRITCLACCNVQGHVVSIPTASSHLTPRTSSNSIHYTPLPSSRQTISSPCPLPTPLSINTNLRIWKCQAILSHTQQNPRTEFRGYYLQYIRYNLPRLPTSLLMSLSPKSHPPPRRRPCTRESRRPNHHFRKCDEDVVF